MQSYFFFRMGVGWGGGGKRDQSSMYMSSISAGSG